MTVSYYQRCANRLVQLRLLLCSDHLVFQIIERVNSIFKFRRKLYLHLLISNLKVFFLFLAWKLQCSRLGPRWNDDACCTACAHHCGDVCSCLSYVSCLLLFKFIKKVQCCFEQTTETRRPINENEEIIFAATHYINMKLAIAEWIILMLSVGSVLAKFGPQGNSRKCEILPRVYAFTFTM